MTPLPCSSPMMNILALSTLLPLYAATQPSDTCAVTGTAKPSWKNSFPPKNIAGDGPAVAAWFEANIDHLKPPPPMTDREKYLVKMSATEFIKLRKADKITCYEYASALASRATYYRHMNQFMYWDVFPDQMEKFLKDSQALDEKARTEGVASIGPLYCLPVPQKGTMATKEYPSSAGVGLLHSYYATDDADAVKLLKKNGGLGFGKTMVPEFAASWVSCNYANGCSMNPYNRLLTTGGSSGGSGSAVASYIAPVAFTEDTGGSTRHPAYQNHNFGYDPSRNRYPNAGNPGMSYTNDQVGINARSMEDVLTFDKAYLDIPEIYEAVSAKTPEAKDIKIGVPRYPFVEYYAHEGGENSFDFPVYPKRQLVSANIEKKYREVIETLERVGVGVVSEEWSERNGRNAVADLLEFRTVNGKRLPKLIPMHSFTGQMAEFILTYLNASVALSDIAADIYAAGEGHNPLGFFDASRSTDESQLRYMIGEHTREMVEVWNSYFDEHGVDLILTPGQFCDAITYTCQANSTCTIRRGEGFEGESIEYTDASDASVSHCVFVSYFFFKSIPVPKMTVPVGLGDKGEPVSVMLMGRAGPPHAKDHLWIYEDDSTKASDVDFLHKVNTIVTAMTEANPSLARAEPALVTMASPPSRSPSSPPGSGGGGAGGSSNLFQL